MGKNIIILLLSITVILSAATFLTTQNLDKPTNDAGFLMGHMTLKVIDENGYVRDYRQTDNVIVESGWDTLVQNAFTSVDGFVGGIPTPLGGSFSHMAIGTDDFAGTPNLALAEDNAALGAEATTCSRVFIKDITSAGAGAVTPGVLDFTLSATFSAVVDAGCAGTGDITEAGVFNADISPNGEMFARNSFTPVPELGVNDSLEIEWDFTFNSEPVFIGP